MTPQIMAAMVTDQAIRNAGGVLFVGTDKKLCVWPKRVMNPHLAAKVARNSAALRLLIISRAL